MVSSVSSTSNVNYQIPDIPPLYCPTGMNEFGDLEFAYQGNKYGSDTMMQSNIPCITGSGCNCNSALNADSFTPSNMGSSISSYTSEDAMNAVCPTDASNDGEFSWGEAINNLGSGIISPFKQLLTPEGLLAAGAVTVAAAAIGPAAVPALLALGVGYTAWNVGQFAFKELSGNGDTQEQGFKDLGEAVISGLTLGYCGRGALAKAGTDVAGMSRLDAIASTFKRSTVTDVWSALRSGNLKTNLQTNLGNLWNGITSGFTSLKDRFIGASESTKPITVKIDTPAAQVDSEGIPTGIYSRTAATATEVRDPSVAQGYINMRQAAEAQQPMTAGKNPYLSADEVEAMLETRLAGDRQYTRF